MAVKYVIVVYINVISFVWIR